MASYDDVSVGIAQAASNLAQVGAGIGESKAQRNWQEKMADLAWERNKEAWNMQNEYNSPSAQKKRYMDAGLNPLLFGVDSGTSGSFSAPLANSYERAAIEQLPNPVNSALQAAMSVAQIDNIQAQTAKTSQETQSEVAKREKIKIEADKIKQEISNLMVNEDLSREQITQLQILNKWNDKIQEASLSKINSEIHVNESAANRIDSLIEGEKLLQSYNIHDFEEKWSNLRAQTKKILNDSRLTDLDIDNYLLNHMSNGVFGSGASIQNIIRGLMDKVPKSKPNEGDGSGVLDPPSGDMPLRGINWENKWPTER